MEEWVSILKYDPFPNLISSDHQAIKYFVQRDLLHGEPIAREVIWNLPQPKQILRKQLESGAWSRNGVNKHPAINIELIETWRNLRYLVDMYGFDSTHPQIQKAIDYVFHCQSDEGDFRGFLANQYATYYTGALISLLIKAGVQTDPRIEKGMRWLLAMRQNDGGWSIPMITHTFSREEQYRLSSEHLPPIEPDRSKPFSHNWTGMVLRAFAEHDTYRNRKEVIHAAFLLTSRFFQKDVYTSYQDASYWLRFEYPFWWNNLVAALDSVTRIHWDPSSKKIKEAIHWLIEHQNPDGTWNYTYVSGKYKANPKNQQVNLWVTLAICRIFKRIYPSY